ncbi:MAG: hypothetical protein KF830_09830 [Planctomycetes bacterium]|nr:hypothetical protein [Planctomycetota bacterium]
MSRGAVALAAAAVAVGLSGCIASNVVATQDRMVTAAVAELAFAPAPGLRPEGLYESVEITGDAAVSLRKVYYLFLGDGTYTAAALVDDAHGGAFQILTGTWASGPEGLVLDGAEAVPLEQAPRHLRLSAPNGTVVLRQGELR